MCSQSGASTLSSSFVEFVFFCGPAAPKSPVNNTTCHGPVCLCMRAKSLNNASLTFGQSGGWPSKPKCRSVRCSQLNLLGDSTRSHERPYLQVRQSCPSGKPPREACRTRTTRVNASPGFHADGNNNVSRAPFLSKSCSGASQAKPDGARTRIAIAARQEPS